MLLKSAIRCGQEVGPTWLTSDEIARSAVSTSVPGSASKACCLRIDYDSDADTDSEVLVSQIDEAWGESCCSPKERDLQGTILMCNRDARVPLAHDTGEPPPEI